MADDENPSESQEPDRRLWFWRPFFHKHESAATKQAKSDIFAALPRESVTDEYGTRPKWNKHIEDIFKSMPPDSKRLHPGEPRWQTLLAPKYIKNENALARFMAKMRSTDADDAYLYFPLGADAPKVWYEHSGRHPSEDVRYSVAEFEEKWGF